MILPDVNVLLYAYDMSSKHHLPCKAWWERCLSSSETVGLAWSTALGFLRIATSEHFAGLTRFVPLNKSSGQQRLTANERAQAGE